MKLNHFFCLITFFISFNIFSQDQIVLKDGSIVVPEKGTLDIIVVDKRIQYQLLGKKWLKYTAFSDLDYVSTNGALLKSFKLNNPNKIKTIANFKFAYFVLVETDKYKLVSVTVDYISNTSSREIIYSLIVDNDNNVVDDLSFVNSYKDKDVQNKKNAVALLRKYFSDLKPEMDAITNTENEPGEYFKYLKYRKYN